MHIPRYFNPGPAPPTYRVIFNPISRAKIIHAPRYEKSGSVYLRALIDRSVYISQIGQLPMHASTLLLLLLRAVFNLFFVAAPDASVRGALSAARGLIKGKSGGIRFFASCAGLTLYLYRTGLILITYRL